MQSLVPALTMEVVMTRLNGGDNDADHTHPHPHAHTHTHAHSSLPLTVLLCSPGLPKTFYVDQVVLKFPETHLPVLGLKACAPAPQ